MRGLVDAARMVMADHVAEIACCTRLDIDGVAPGESNGEAWVVLAERSIRAGYSPAQCAMKRPDDRVIRDMRASPTVAFCRRQDNAQPIPTPLCVSHQCMPIH